MKKGLFPSSNAVPDSTSHIERVTIWLRSTLENCMSLAQHIVSKCGEQVLDKESEETPHHTIDKPDVNLFHDNSENQVEYFVASK